MRTTLVAGAVASLLVGGAQAAPSEWSGCCIILKDAELAAAEPQDLRGGQGGRAVARCHLEDDGALTQCAVVRETPSRSGYGAALIAAARKRPQKPPAAAAPRDVILAGDWFRVDKPTDWGRRPSPQDLVAVYPAKARGDGGTLLNCLVTVQGTLTDCEVLAEFPRGSGFGSAGVALTAQFTMKPVTWKGAPATTTATIPLHWRGFDDMMTNGPGVKRAVSATLPWTEAPSFQDVAAAYPARARERRIGGHVALVCQLSPTGRLTDCFVGSTDPVGMGFDRAAKDLARKFLFQVVTDADRKAAREIQVHLPITFDPAVLDQAVIGKPSWAVLPTQEQVASAFAGVGASGDVVALIDCRVVATGRVEGCAAVSEDPAGKGVGSAAVALAANVRLTTWTNEGLPVVGGHVRIPIRYKAGPPSAADPRR